VIFLRKMEDQDIENVLELEIKEEQTQYVSPITTMLSTLEPSEDCHLLVKEDEIVGFFLIDQNYSHRYDFSEPGEIGLLGYFVDATHQGQGIGKAGVRALKAYLQIQYPDAQAVILTVNCRNLGAIKTYLAGGFEDTQQLYYGGRSGPQHIMRLTLKE
jgi:RimJ/RimL family protein N-acetyltransferase